LPSLPHQSPAAPVELDAAEARAPCPAARRGGHPGVAGARVSRPGQKGARVGATLVFVDEAGCYLLPAAVAAYAPRGQTPRIETTVTHDHLAIISGVTPQGRLFAQLYDDAITGVQVVLFLRHLERWLPGPLIVIWDSA